MSRRDRDTTNKNENDNSHSINIELPRRIQSYRNNGMNFGQPYFISCNNNNNSNNSNDKQNNNQDKRHQTIINDDTIISSFLDDDHDTITDHITATLHNQENNVEGVEWYRNGAPFNDFVDTFTNGIRVTDISGRAKLFLHERYLSLFIKYRQKYKRSKFINNITRIIISIGAICIPALLAIDDEIRERSQASQMIYYTSFGLGIFVSVINALVELSQVSKRFYANATTKQLLEFEGWSFLLLRGVYRKYPNHRNCWQTFLHRIDKIHQQAVSSGLLMYRQQEPTLTGKGNILDPKHVNEEPFFPEEMTTSSLDPLQFENTILQNALDTGTNENMIVFATN